MENLSNLSPDNLSNADLEDILKSMTNTLTTERAFAKAEQNKNEREAWAKLVEAKEKFLKNIK